jgi:hypothetical protein
VFCVLLSVYKQISDIFYFEFFIKKLRKKSEIEKKESIKKKSLIIDSKKRALLHRKVPSHLSFKIRKKKFSEQKFN